MTSGDLPARCRALGDDVSRLAADVGRAMREAWAADLPIEPGVREDRQGGGVAGFWLTM